MTISVRVTLAEKWKNSGKLRQELKAFIFDKELHIKAGPKKVESQNLAFKAEK